MAARQSWVKGRSRRTGDAFDPLAPLQLLNMASAAASFAEGQSTESICFLTGISPATLTMLIPLLQPRQAWVDIQLLSVGRKLSGEDLFELEGIFRRVERAMARATAKEIRAIRAFSTALAGPVAPYGGFSDAAVDGGRKLFTISRLDRLRLSSAPAGRSGLNDIALLGDKSEVVKRCWLEATSLGLLKARLRHVISATRKINQIDARIE